MDATEQSQPPLPRAAQSAKLLQELQGIERRIVQVLEIGATAIDALAAASEDKEEAMQKFAKSATAYYELLKVISLALRAKIDQVLEMGIMPQITGQPNVPFRPNLYGEEKDLELRAKAVFVLRKELEKMIETLEAGGAGSNAEPELTSSMELDL